MDDMQQLLMRVLFEVTESRIEMRQEFASFRKDVDQRFDRVEARLDRVEERLDGVETRLDRVETRLDNVDERVGKLETTVETMASDMKAMDANMKAMASDMKEMDANMKAMASDMKTMDAKIESIDEKNHQRFIQVHEHIDRVDQARVEGEERIMNAIDLILDGSGLGKQIVKKPTIVRG